MHKPPNDTTDSDTLLDEVVAAYLQTEAEGGEPVRQQWLERYPGLSSELSEFFTDWDRVRHWMSPFAAVLQDTSRPDAALSPLPSIAGYELLACLGQGGRGVVYKARQLSLRRVVALKMLRPDDLASPTDLQRFRGEAELIALLDHSGIVPVYEVGDADGRPFFTMKLIEGGSLAERLSALGVWLSAKDAAELTATVARAVHYAHQRGILHRDLKPGNILLDTDGQPLVTDFGLAKRVANSGFPPGENSLTQSQAIVGTPSYMAPEQTQGAKATATTATDVYGLGAILYALLTGRPPFAGSSVLDTLEQVRTHDPVPPRTLQPSVPRDLETICLKCLTKEPAQRYASAAHLAEDLGRFLEGKTIQARPARMVHRLGKWARRQPALAGLLSVTLLAPLLVGSLMVRHQRQLRTALQEAQRHADEAQRRKEVAMANYRQARETIDRMLAHARNPRHGDLPRLVELRRAQQEDALAFLLKAAEQQGDEPEVLSDVADARILAAQLQAALGQSEAGRANVTSARELLARLVSSFPEEPTYRARLAYAWMVLGIRYQVKDESVSSIQRALAIYEALAAEGVDVGSGLAMAHHNLADVLHRLGKRTEAEDHWRKAVTLHARLQRASPEAPEHRRALAQTQVNLSVLLQGQQGRLAEAAEFHEQAEGHLEQLLRADPSDLDSIHDLALLRVNWAYVLLHTGKSGQALENLGKNEQLLRSVLDREPNLVRLREVLFRTYGVRATIQEQQGLLAEAVADYERVVALSPLTERNAHRLTLAVLRGKAGDHARAVAEAEALARELPNPTSWKRFYALARTCSDAIEVLEKDEAIEAAARPLLAERYAASALRLLERARNGASKAEWQKQEVKLNDDFRPLAGREAYRQWRKANTP